MKPTDEKAPVARWRLLAVLAVGLTIWASPAPEALDPRAWQLLAIFLATIFAVLIDAMPVLTASVLAVAITVLSGTLTAAEAYSGFSQSFLLLLTVAFLVAQAVVNSGLGQRIAYAIIVRLGRSTLGLAYSLIITDFFIAPAFPSNTARSGVLYPIHYALARQSGSRTEDGTQGRMGSFLMMAGMTGLTVSSAMWMTAMAANPAGAGIATLSGIPVSFGSWALAASLPSLAAVVIVPYLLYRVFPPGVRHTPEAPAAAAEALRAMGPPSRQEWITAMTFAGMVTGWALSASLGLNTAAIAFLGLGVLMLANVFTLDDLKGRGDALGIYFWFAILYTLSTQLNELGFMSYAAGGMASQLEGLAWPVVYVALIVIYVLIHYLFVSQTAHMLALYGVFLHVGLQAGVPGPLLAYMLLFATNFFAAITPQGSSANAIFLSSGYIEPRQVYRYGGLVTLFNLIVYLVVGTPWILLVT
ncbi:MAG TPA: DASS family sodium-coupled anion symporter [Acidobacteriota bacterium]|nr:DASS family sodium-coupled anion symporter [Acidobacteriota bacterium]